MALATKVSARMAYSVTPVSLRACFISMVPCEVGWLQAALCEAKVAPIRLGLDDLASVEDAIDVEDVEVHRHVAVVVDIVEVGPLAQVDKDDVGIAGVLAV